MRTPIGGLRPALIALVSLVVLAAPAPASAARCNDTLPLHGASSGRLASCGTVVKDVQWLTGGHRPYVWTRVKATFKWEPNGAYGARTKAAVRAMKYRLGFPRAHQCGAATDEVTDRAGRFFIRLLEGKERRPACWAALVSGRLKAIEAAKPSRTALAVRALELAWLGIRESPYGSNRGPCISYSCTWHGTGYPAIQSSTGAYSAAWCVSTQQEAFKLVGYGTFANATAGVYYALDYYAARNLVFAKAKVGSLVAFVTYDSRGHRVAGTGHMGLVVAVQANSFTYTAGNDSNGVREHTIPMGSRPYAFIRLPGVA